MDVDLSRYIYERGLGRSPALVSQSPCPNEDLGKILINIKDSNARSFFISSLEDVKGCRACKLSYIVLPFLEEGEDTIFQLQPRVIAF